jgi:hypothetical protein
VVLTALGAITLSQRDAEEYKKTSAFYNGPEPRPAEPGAKPNAKQMPNKKAGLSEEGPAETAGKVPKGIARGGITKPKPNPELVGVPPSERVPQKKPEEGGDNALSDEGVPAEEVLVKKTGGAPVDPSDIPGGTEGAPGSSTVDPSNADKLKPPAAPEPAVAAK